MDKYFLDDTIAAVSTPNGVGAIAVIRVSGKDSIRITGKVFKGGKNLNDAASHTIHYGKLISRKGLVIDDVLVSIFKAPKSYTGEDSVEISSHGNPLISQQILQLLVENGIRLAEAGEFTKRAFLNGRIDLIQAEAVAEIIQANSETALRGARNQLDGLLSQRVNYLKERLINSSSLIELELDFAEEDIEFVDFWKVKELITETIKELDELIGSYSFGKIIKDGVNVALVGKPNVGKSSLLNYLVKEYRAIVSEIPGTTRDIIREDITIDGILFRLNDTAGIRESNDIIEREGVARSRQAIVEADLVLFINDAIEGVDDIFYDSLTKITKAEKIIRVVNKIDLVDEHDIEADAYISAKKGIGFSELFSLLKKKAIGQSVYTEKSAIVSSIRHFKNLNDSKEYLICALESINSKMSGEFISVDLRKSINSLAEIIGEISSDDILNNIFQKFCIGK